MSFWTPFDPIHQLIYKLCQTSTCFAMKTSNVLCLFTLKIQHVFNHVRLMAPASHLKDRLYSAVHDSLVEEIPAKMVDKFQTVYYSGQVISFAFDMTRTLVHKLLLSLHDNNNYGNFSIFSRSKNMHQSRK